MAGIRVWMCLGSPYSVFHRCRAWRWGCQSFQEAVTGRETGTCQKPQIKCVAMSKRTQGILERGGTLRVGAEGRLTLSIKQTLLGGAPTPPIRCSKGPSWGLLLFSLSVSMQGSTEHSKMRKQASLACCSVGRAEVPAQVQS